MSPPRIDSDKLTELRIAVVEAEQAVTDAAAAKHRAIEALQNECVHAEVERLAKLGIKPGDKVIVENHHHAIRKIDPLFEAAFLSRVYGSGKKALWDLVKVKKDGTPSLVKWIGIPVDITPYRKEALEEPNS